MTAQGPCPAFKRDLHIVKHFAQALTWPCRNRREVRSHRFGTSSNLARRNIVVRVSPWTESECGPTSLSLVPFIHIALAYGSSNPFVPACNTGTSRCYSPRRPFSTFSRYAFRNVRRNRRRSVGAHHRARTGEGGRRDWRMG